MGVSVFKIYSFYYTSHRVPRDEINLKKGDDFAKSISESTSIDNFTLIEHEDPLQMEEDAKFSIKTV